jgi:hypothetical protein
MAVLMTAEIPGATKEMIDGMRPLLDEIVKQKGFVIHTNGPSRSTGASAHVDGADDARPTPRTSPTAATTTPMTHGKARAGECVRRSPFIPSSEPRRDASSGPSVSRHEQNASAVRLA